MTSVPDPAGTITLSVATPGCMYTLYVHMERGAPMADVAHRRKSRLVPTALVLAWLLGSLLGPQMVVAQDATHTVSEGDTLSAIALNYGTTVEELVALNGLVDPNLIVIGTSLIVPDKWSTPVAWETASAADTGWTSSGDNRGWVEVDGEWVWYDPPYVARETIVAMLIEAAQMYGWEPSLILAQAWQESRWRQDGISHAGAIGVMQVLPETAAEVGAWYLGRDVDPWSNVWDNIETGVAFLTILYEETGSVDLALAAYYQGLGSLQRDGWFADTAEYVSLIYYWQELILAGEL
ncbi:MAG: hypothetical protein DCC58_05830 [Chloroflexi bacterium]|nr:MAG: hypothetical protein DCC58_05830 [Chloroflexota bacterium]